MGGSSIVRHRLAPYALVAGLVVSALLSWLSHSVVLATVAGALISITPLPLSSWVAGAKAGALIGGLAGALAEGILFSPARGVARIFIATGYGIALGALWGCVVGRFLNRAHGSARVGGRELSSRE